MLFSIICRRPVFSGSEGVPKQRLKAMKLTIFFLIVVCLQVSAAGYGQKGTVTISGKDLPLEKVFNVIKKQTDYVCFYGYDVLKNARPVSLNFKDADVQEVLKAALWGQGLDFSITGKTITIMKRIVAASSGPVRTVKAAGVVYNEVGQPLSGANVTIKATGKGTITNAKGEFKLTAPENSTLVISYIGFSPKEIIIKEGENFEVYLKVAKNELDKVVIQAYGTTTQRLATGDLATVTAEEIEKQPVSNPLQALQGRVAGLVIAQRNGNATAPFRVELRGRNTIGNVPPDPLYIIDGVPLTVLEVERGGSSYAGGSTGFVQNPYMPGPAGGQSPFFSMNPADIESVTVLKDADATAIYGSRGANGVIIITTKSGSVGKTKLDLNVYEGLSVVTNHYDLLNNKQYLQMRREALANDNIVPNTANAYDLLIWDTTRNIDWQKYVWGHTGKALDAQVALSGGNKQTNYRLGAGYYRVTDVTTQSGASQRGSIQFNLSHKSLDQRLNMSFSTNYSVVGANLVSVGGLVLSPPHAPDIWDGKGNLNFKGWQPIDRSFPFGKLLQPYSATTYFLNSRLSLNFEILKGLTFSGNFGYSTATTNQLSKKPIASQDPVDNPTGSAQFGYNNNINWIIEPQLKYNCLLGKGKLDLMTGASTQGVAFTGNDIMGEGYTNDNLLGSIANAPSKDVFDSYVRYRYAAVFGRITYNWDNKYIINASARRDGSSRFGPGKQFGNFAAIGAAWIFSEEGWVKQNLKFLSFGKIRGSYGTSGNDQIGDYAYLTRWTDASVVPYQGSASYIPTQHANPDYQWEVNKKLEMAIDLNFLKDRISLEVATYRNRCGNQLVTYPLALLTGFPGVTANFPADVQNTGLEITLRGKIIDKQNLSWSANFNLGLNRNKLLAFPNIENTPYANQLFVGKPLFVGQALHFKGVDPQTGQYTYEDKNKDGTISTDLGAGGDMYVYDLTPKYSGGFGSDFSYKSWQLSMFFHFKSQIADNALENIRPPGGKGILSNEPVNVLNRWRKPGDIAQYARFTTNPNASDYFLTSSDIIYTDASFIRLTNLAVSYSFSEKWTKRAGLTALKIYARGENLFVITKYKGVDPETQAFNFLPPTKIFTGGLQIVF